MDVRENFLAFLNHENTEWVPTTFSDYYSLGGAAEEFENGPVGGGEDGFGVLWLATHSASGSPVPAPNRYVITDITDWEKQLKLPDTDNFDWKGYAEEQLASIGNKRDKVVEYQMWNSQFLRMTHLMGFENALCAFYEEPEACAALMDAITDYKIKVLERVNEYIKPDTYVHFDDVATERGLFISPDIYRELIKPCHKKLNDAAISMGIIPQIHICGKCESIIPDVIEEGSVAWQCAQPSNDIEGIIEKYGDRFSVLGGYDTQGRPGVPTATEEQIINEVDRCFDEYGKFGRGYAFFGFLLGESGDKEMQRKTGILVKRAAERSRKA
ncbi:MAG: hypothetical protein MJ067_00640 [Oscillospiraceae bacterium]|nr:hypothetical protein [Oscillospiraceae bacterium]